MLSEKTFVKHGVIEEKDINYNHIFKVLDIIETEKKSNPTVAKNIESKLKKAIYRNSNKKSIDSAFQHEKKFKIFKNNINKII